MWRFRAFFKFGKRFPVCHYCHSARRFGCYFDQTHMKNHFFQIVGIAFVAAVGCASAGETIEVEAPKEKKPKKDDDWCDLLDDFSTIYKEKKKKNPFIQRIDLSGRIHYQYGYTDGEDGDLNFSGDRDELRRFRFGGSVRFLDNFTLNARANFVNNISGSSEIEYVSFNNLNLEYDFGDIDALGLDNVKIGYGRYKIAIGGEEHSSSRKLKTIERSNLNNFYAPSRATGVMIEAERKKVDFTLGVFTVDRDFETLAQWEGGVAYYASVDFKVADGDMIIDFLYNDSDVLEDEVIGYEWATSLTYETEIGGVDLFTNVAYGETHEGDNVYGIVIMPSKEIIEDRLEAVLRYQWARSSGDDLVRAQNRNIRNVAQDDIGYNPKRGDNNHTIYAGLNYFLCGNNARLMAGVEYETVEGDRSDLDAMTYWLAARLSF